MYIDKYFLRNSHHVLQIFHLGLLGNGIIDPLKYIIAMNITNIYELAQPAPIIIRVKSIKT